MPVPPPPVSVKLPLLLIVLLVSTLKTTGLALRTKLPEAVLSALIVTPVLPVCAITAAMPLPVQVTVVLLGGAVLLHAAMAEGVNAFVSSTTLPRPIPNVFFFFIRTVLVKGTAPYERNGPTYTRLTKTFQTSPT